MKLSIFFEVLLHFNTFISLANSQPDHFSSEALFVCWRVSILMAATGFADVPTEILVRHVIIFD
jgi:hypothetical protein